MKHNSRREVNPSDQLQTSLLLQNALGLRTRSERDARRQFLLTGVVQKMTAKGLVSAKGLDTSAI